MSSTQGLRMHIFAGRHRAHDIGDGEDRRVVRLALERGGEAVVAEFGVYRIGGSDPVERAGIAGRGRDCGLSISKPAGR